MLLPPAPSGQVSLPCSGHARAGQTPGWADSRLGGVLISVSYVSVSLLTGMEVSVSWW